MSKDVIMPALGMAQETGLLLEWLKAPGATVTKGEALMLIETDKASVEIEAPASGILANVTAKPGDHIPVGQVIAAIVSPEEQAAVNTKPAEPPKAKSPIASAPTPARASPLAARIAAEHGIDLTQIKPRQGMIQKEDVLAFIAAHPHLTPSPALEQTGHRPVSTVQEKGAGDGGSGVRTLASPKARRLAREGGVELAMLKGSGPGGAVLAADVVTTPVVEPIPMPAATPTPAPLAEPLAPEATGVTRTWQVMVERLSHAWTTIPHFYLVREVNATQLIAWREQAQQRSNEKVTYTDLLVKLTAAALQKHPRLNASWRDNTIAQNPEINIGIAVAVEEGLVVPVIQHADQLGLNQIVARRQELVDKARTRRLTLDDLSGGTFTISNLGMYGVDAFNAIINPPQAAILAVSRIADRVVAVNKQPVVLPMLTLTLSCDHRVADGARAAEFLQTLAELMEEPMRLLD